LDTVESELAVLFVAGVDELVWLASLFQTTFTVGGSAGVLDDDDELVFAPAGGACGGEAGGDEVPALGFDGVVLWPELELPPPPALLGLLDPPVVGAGVGFAGAGA
jgi:hypothetical protein